MKSRLEFKGSILFGEFVVDDPGGRRIGLLQAIEGLLCRHLIGIAKFAGILAQDGVPRFLSDCSMVIRSFAKVSRERLYQLGNQTEDPSLLRSDAQRDRDIVDHPHPFGILVGLNNHCCPLFGVKVASLVPDDVNMPRLRHRDVPLQDEWRWLISGMNQFPGQFLNQDLGRLGG